MIHNHAKIFDIDFTQYRLIIIITVALILLFNLALFLRIERQIIRFQPNGKEFNFFI